MPASMNAAQRTIKRNTLETRLALVIGNGDYKSSPLANPVNDARDMALVLKKLGFKVIYKENSGLRAMEEAVLLFGNRLKKGRGAGLFYFAGHGVQIAGKNYLIPVGARIKKETDVKVEELAKEFMERRRRGEHPSISEYELKYPQLSEEIRELFPMVRAIEELKQSRDRAVNAPFPAGSPRIKQLGEFHIIRELGRGGMGVVCEAMQESLNRPIAVKVLSQHPFFNADALKRFQREAHIAARLEHPNIVPIHSIGEAQGCHFIAMQRAFGGLDWIA